MHVHTTRHDNYFLRRTCVNNQSIWMVLPLHDLSKLFALRFSIFVPLPSKMRMKLTTGSKRYLDQLFCIAITSSNAFYMRYIEDIRFSITKSWSLIRITFEMSQQQNKCFWYDFKYATIDVGENNKNNNRVLFAFYHE